MAEGNLCQCPPPFSESVPAALLHVAPECPCVIPGVAGSVTDTGSEYPHL